MIFPEGSFCGNGECKVSSAVKTLKHCSRCSLAQYCSPDCQRTDFKAHKTDCKIVHEIKNRLTEIEPFLKRFRWTQPDHTMKFDPRVQDLMKTLSFWNDDDVPPENAFETRVGEFYRIKNRTYGMPLWDDPAKIWPKDYLILKMRRAEAMWRIASRHEDKSAVEKVLSELLEIVRLDADDAGNRAYPMLGFILLDLGRVDEAYNVVKFRIVHTEFKIRLEKCKNLKPGEFMRFEDEQDKLEDIFDAIPHDKINNAEMAFLLCIVAIKIQAVLDMKKNDEKKKMVYEIEEQMDQIRMLMGFISRQNSVMLPALVNPQPLLSQPLQQAIFCGTPAEVAEVLQYSWQFFDKTKGSKAFLLKFLDPYWKKGQPLPDYDVNVFPKDEMKWLKRTPYDKVRGFYTGN